MGTPTLQVAFIALAGVLLIAFGLVFKARSDDRQTYHTRARGTGIEPGRFDDVYRAYQHNRAFVGNIAIWIGSGLVIATIFNLV